MAIKQWFAHWAPSMWSDKTLNNCILRFKRQSMNVPLIACSPLTSHSSSFWTTTLICQLVLHAVCPVEEINEGKMLHVGMQNHTGVFSTHVHRCSWEANHAQTYKRTHECKEKRTHINADPHLAKEVNLCGPQWSRGSCLKANLCAAGSCCCEHIKARMEDKNFINPEGNPCAREANTAL